MEKTEKFTLKVKVLSTEKRDDFSGLPEELNSNLFNYVDNLSNEDKNQEKIENHLNSLKTGYKYSVKHIKEEYGKVLYSIFEITKRKN
jgi:esterase/lipase